MTNPAGTDWPNIIYGTAWIKDATAGLVRQAITTGCRADTALLHIPCGRPFQGAKL